MRLLCACWNTAYWSRWIPPSLSEQDYALRSAFASKVCSLFSSDSSKTPVQRLLTQSNQDWFSLGSVSDFWKRMDLKGNVTACGFFFFGTENGRAGDVFKWLWSASWHLVTAKLNINCETLQSIYTCMRTAGITLFHLSCVDTVWSSRSRWFPARLNKARTHHQFCPWLWQSTPKHTQIWGLHAGFPWGGKKSCNRKLVVPGCCAPTPLQFF